ncbi:hypothetical protein BGZ54_007850 [Gamsiella multidivaricata]|nr:hypothetical protein BGZ54_007850 [Gamsiella multidivaricata]
MTAITSSLRSIRAPAQALARRQYSSAVLSAAPTPASAKSAVTTGHSNQRIAIASGLSFAIGVDVTYAYFTLFHKKDISA